MKEAKVFETPIPTFFSTKPLNALARRCATCHQSSNDYPNSFLTGSEEQVIEKVTTIRKKILHRIESGQMPPSVELQKHFLDSSDREAILKYIKDLSSD